jgi:autotransporter passenger strand-loop-strand repeat protein
MSTIIVSSGKVTSVTSATPAGQYIVEGGTLVIGKGGVTSGVELKTGSESVLASGKTYGDVVSGGSETIRKGGIASGAAVSGKGEQILSSGGTSTASIIKKGGQEIVNAGGIASGSLVSNGGKLVVDGGAHVTGLKVTSGGTVDLAGGTFTGTVASGGIEAVTAAANHIVYKGLKVSSGVTLTVSSGGKTSATVISAGATMIVSSGGTANATTLGAGAVETVEAGGSIGGTTKLGAQSVLDIVVATNVTSLTVSGFGNENKIELDGFTISQPSVQYAPIVGSPTPQGILTITAESHTASIHLFGQYVAAGFHVNGVQQNITVTYAPPVAAVATDFAVGHHMTGR